ncbi:MAG: hypothetical protein ACJAYX_004084 [Planctomycetota bacterium]|jgi:hypothetical protein
MADGFPSECSRLTKVSLTLHLTAPLAGKLGDGRLAIDSPKVLSRPAGVVALALLKLSETWTVRGVRALMLACTWA